MQWQQQLDAIVAHSQQVEKLLCIAHQKPVVQRLGSVVDELIDVLS